MITHRLRLTALVVLVASAIAAPRAEGPREAFAKKWEGRRVMVLLPMYSLVFNERSRLGSTREGRRDGLTVVTPQGVYLQFDGRQSRDDVTVTLRDAQRIVDLVATMYQPDTLESRPYRKIEPLLLARYDPGAELVVRSVKFDRDVVRLAFAQPAGPDVSDDLVTSLTVKWPTLLSKSFSERDLVDNLIRRFIDDK